MDDEYLSEWIFYDDVVTHATVDAFVAYERMSKTRSKIAFAMKLFMTGVRDVFNPNAFDLITREELVHFIRGPEFTCSQVAYEVEITGDSQDPLVISNTDWLKSMVKSEFSRRDCQRLFTVVMDTKFPTIPQMEASDYDWRATFGEGPLRRVGPGKINIPIQSDRNSLEKPRRNLV
jgi:hypothetical protein